MPEESKISVLIIKYLKEELLPSEQKELRHWVDLSKENALLFARLTGADTLQEEIKEFHEVGLSIKEKIDGQLQGDAVIALSLRRSRVRRLARIAAAAACFILLAGVGIYFWTAHSSNKELTKTPILSPAKNNILPGANKAVLTLAGGQKVILDSVTNGTVAEEGSTKIVQLQSGQLTYQGGRPAKSSSEQALAYNTLTTPRSGQFQITLPDHTKVWMNNASQLHYPTSFPPGKERLVELSGEAYFEVAKDPSRPFKVRVNELTVNALGTSFNIMAYPDENVLRTTLLQGSVRLTTAHSQTLLKPDQQAELSPLGNWKVLSVDAEKSIAYTKGFFHFDHADIKTVMRQLARWYDVEVEYKGPVTDHFYGGDIHRDLRLSVVLEFLEKSDAHFKIEGNKVIVTK